MNFKKVKGSNSHGLNTRVYHSRVKQKLSNPNFSLLVSKHHQKQGVIDTNG
jgi:hypothetical protein